MGIKCSRYNIKGSSFRDQTEEEGSIILTYFKFQATKIRAKKKKKFKFSRNFTFKSKSFSLVGSIDRSFHNCRASFIRFEESIKGGNSTALWIVASNDIISESSRVYCGERRATYTYVPVEACSGSSSSRRYTLVHLLERARNRSGGRREKSVWMGYRSVVCGPAVFLVDRNASWGGPGCIGRRGEAEERGQQSARERAEVWKRPTKPNTGG